MAPEEWEPASDPETPSFDDLGVQLEENRVRPLDNQARVQGGQERWPDGRSISHLLLKHRWFGLSSKLQHRELDLGSGCGRLFKRDQLVNRTCVFSTRYLPLPKLQNKDHTAGEIVSHPYPIA
jgi:hypothetical protein